MSGLAAHSLAELQRFRERASAQPSPAMLEASALCDRELGAAPVDDSEPERCGKRECYRTAARSPRAKRSR